MTRATESPLVTVLMAVYNGEKFLREAIESILNQTYTNFEFLIINDGSADSTEEIILSYNDDRIRYIKNAQNLKLIASLNRGLDLANGKYIARMDADDISLPERLEKQIRFLEKHPKVGVLGSWVRTLGLQENYDVKFEQGHTNIRFKLFFNNYLHHPTVVLRRSVIEKYKLRYPNVLHAEDYALWIEMTNFCQIDILPEVLLKYRVHGANISVKNSDFQKTQTFHLRKRQLESMGIFCKQNELELYFKMLDGYTDYELKEFLDLLLFLEKIELKIKFKFIRKLYLLNNEKLNQIADVNSYQKKLHNRKGFIYILFLRAKLISKNYLNHLLDKFK